MLKKKEVKPNIPVCSLLDANAKVRTFFDVEADWDEQFPVLYFMMYDIKDKKKRRMSDIVVDYSKRKDDVLKLVQFLRKWSFDKDKTSLYYFACDCNTDLFAFTKLRNFREDKDDNMYIDFFSSGGSFRKKQTIEVNITKDQALVLANQLERFLAKKEAANAVEEDS